MRSALRSLLFAAALTVVTGCDLPTVVPEAQSSEYVPLGEVMFRDRGASFDAVRVRSPKCNLAKRTDGSWGGTFADRALDVTVTETTIRGVEFMLTREDSKPGHAIITGQFQGRIYRFELDENQALVRTATTSLTFPGRLIAENVVKYGPMQNLELRGEAGNENPPWPQLGFALMAAFY
jgi:hypothetical protein